MLLKKRKSLHEYYTTIQGGIQYLTYPKYHQKVTGSVQTDPTRTLDLRVIRNAMRCKLTDPKRKMDSCSWNPFPFFCICVIYFPIITRGRAGGSRQFRSPGKPFPCGNQWFCLRHLWLLLRRFDNS